MTRLRAAIDIGSNSVRLLIAETNKNGLRAVKQSVITTRLGGAKRGQALNPDAVQATINALQEFHRDITAAGITEAPVIAATSAVREATNGAEFATLIKQELNWDLQILPGEAEAMASYTGAASVAPGAAVIDVGGGSTELIFPTANGLKSKSVPVGAVRLHKGEVSTDELTDKLKPLSELEPPENIRYAAVGGTITSLAAIKNELTEYTRATINGTVITTKELQAYYEMMLATGPDELRRRYPLLKERADIICDGLLIFIRLSELLGFSELIVSDSGILDGLLLLNP